MGKYVNANTHHILITATCARHAIDRKMPRILGVALLRAKGLVGHGRAPNIIHVRSKLYR